MAPKATNGDLSFEQLLEGSASSMQGRDPARLMGFFAHEMQQFFMHMQMVAAHYAQTGELPNSLFKGGHKGASVTGKRKRKASAFNIFVKHKMAEMKAAGVKPEEGSEAAGQKNPLFKMAVNAWSGMTEQEKEEWKRQVADAEGEASQSKEEGEEEEEEGMEEEGVAEEEEEDEDEEDD